jgi:hypothetical protein
MDLGEVLKRYYKPGCRKVLINILHNHSLYEPLQCHVKNFTADINRSALAQNLQLYQLLVGDIMISLTLWHRSLPAEINHNDDAALMIHLAATLVHHPIPPEAENNQIYCRALTEITRSNPLAIDWNKFSLLLAKGNHIVSKGAGSKTHHLIQLSPCDTRRPYFTYISRKGDKHNQRNFQAFLDLFEKIFPKVKTIFKIAKLFENCSIPFIIYVPKDDLRAVLEIFRMLHEDGRIKCNFTRGVFKHLQAHFEPPGDEVYPDNKDFYRLKISSLKNKDEQQMILERIRPFRERFCINQVL